MMPLLAAAAPQFRLSQLISSAPTENALLRTVDFVIAFIFGDAAAVSECAPFFLFRLHECITHFYFNIFFCSVHFVLSFIVGVRRWERAAGTLYIYILLDRCIFKVHFFRSAFSTQQQPIAHSPSSFFISSSVSIG